MTQDEASVRVRDLFLVLVKVAKAHVDSLPHRDATAVVMSAGSAALAYLILWGMMLDTREKHPERAEHRPSTRYLRSFVAGAMQRIPWPAAADMAVSKYEDDDDHAIATARRRAESSL